MIFSHVLYQLSYPGNAAAAVLKVAKLRTGERLDCAYGEAAAPWQA
jgi:hypothetical protein